MTTEADTVFVGGSVFAGRDERSRPSAVAVSSGRIVAVGSDDQIRELAGRGTEVVNLDGGMVSPGFQDAHVHAVLGGVAMLQCELHGARSAEECLAIVAAYAAANPDATWIVGSGWALEFFPGGTPTRQALDAVVSDRPVYLTNRDAHGTWVNSLALTLAGIDKHTPDPVDGRIEREPDGTPSGTLQEGAAHLLDPLLPPTIPEQMAAGLLKGQEHLFSLGVTSWQDAAIRSMFGLPDIFATYREAAQSGALKARVVGALWWDRERGAEQIPELLERRSAGQVGRFSPTSVKIMQDGVAENFTAGMLEPYLDACGCATANSGQSLIDPAELCEYVTLLDAQGFQVHFHALGDRAVRQALDAIEAARLANGPSEGRHQLAHLQVVHPDDIPRFQQLNAIANIQAFWAAHEPQMDDLTIPFLGERRSAWQFPFGELHRAGAHLAAGSDWSVTSANPLDGIHVAVNRVHPGVDAEPLYPRNRLSLATALTAYTAGSAYANHQEHHTGTIKVGALADLVTLDRDPFDHPIEQISEARVTRTYVGGELVYQG